jgi:protein O-GlcNAc transferase
MTTSELSAGPCDFVASRDARSIGLSVFDNLARFTAVPNAEHKGADANSAHISSCADPVPPMPHMADDELAVFGGLLRGAKKALEYGCGGSTVLAASHSNLQVFGVESDPAWLLKVEAQPAISRASAAGRVFLEYVNIGPTKKWGKPINESYRHNWPRYSSMPWSRQSDYNLIFVDGRFRVACILHAVLKARSDATIVVHDFWNRPQYHVVLPFLDWKQSCGTLGVFQRRSKIDSDLVETLIEKYQYISA